MIASLAQAPIRRHPHFMAGKARIDDDALRVGRAVARLRERVGVTQAAAGAAYPDKEEGITSQYWAMIENGKVPGVFKPAMQRKILDALNAASGTGEPLTSEDLERELTAAGPEASMARLARELGRPLPSDAERFEFSTVDGPVVLTMPGHLSPEGFKDLEAFVAVFLQRKRAAFTN